MLTSIMICWWYFQLWGHHDVSNQEWGKQKQENTCSVSLFPGETLFTHKDSLWSEDGYNTSGIDTLDVLLCTLAGNFSIVFFSEENIYFNQCIYRLWRVSAVACGTFHLGVACKPTLLWHVGICVPSQGLDLGPVHWEFRVSVTGPPGKSQLSFKFKEYSWESYLSSEDGGGQGNNVEKGENTAKPVKWWLFRCRGAAERPSVYKCVTEVFGIIYNSEQGDRGATSGRQDWKMIYYIKKTQSAVLIPSEISPGESKTARVSRPGNPARLHTDPGDGSPSGAETGITATLEEERAAHSSALAWRSPWTRSLVGYSPWGHRETSTTEQLTLGKDLWIWEGMASSFLTWNTFLKVDWHILSW